MVKKPHLTAKEGARVCIGNGECPICGRMEAFFGPCPDCEERFDRTGSYAMRGKKKGPKS